MRLQNIILTGLIRDRLVAYEKLERLMNSDGDINKTDVKIRKLLGKISKFSGMIDELQQIINSNTHRTEDLINELNKKQDG